MNEDLVPIWPGHWRQNPLSCPEQRLIMAVHGALALGNHRSFGN